MAKISKNQSISEKLQSLILSAVFAALVSMFISTTVNDGLNFQGTMVSSLTTVASVVGANAIPAIQAGDAARASKILIAFGADKRIVLAEIVLANQRSFAQFAVNGTDHIPEYKATQDPLLSRAPAAAMHLRFVQIIVPIMNHNRMLGCVRVVASLEELYGHVFWHLGITTAAFATSIMLSLFVANRLRRRIERPITDLVTAMMRVSDEHNLSVHVKKDDDDEIGRIIDKFNDMLDQILERDTRLEQYRGEILRQNEQLTILATRDPLTGILNRRALMEEIDSLSKTVARIGGRIAVIMIDIDHFKLINDTYGHPIGDRVIKSVANTVSEQLRVGDVVGRYGGEEFCAAISATDEREVLRTAERLRERIETCVGKAITPIPGLVVTASLGVALSKSCSSDLTQLVSYADRALYSSKQAGRNRVSLCMPEPLVSGLVLEANRSAEELLDLHASSLQ